MRRAADGKPLRAQEGEGLLALCVINFSTFIESLLIFDVTDCWVEDEAFLCNIVGVAPPHGCGGNHTNTDPKGFLKKVQTFIHLTVEANP